MKQNNAKQMTVSHHGLKGIGNKMIRRMIHHRGRPHKFRGGDGLPLSIPAQIPIMYSSVTITYTKPRSTQLVPALR